MYISICSIVNTEQKQRTDEQVLCTYMQCTDLSNKTIRTQSIEYMMSSNFCELWMSKGQTMNAA